MTQRLITPPTVLAVTLDQAKANLRVDGADMDTLITLWVEGITAALEHEIGQCLMPQTWEVSLEAFPAAINLPHPVISVASVKYMDGAGIEQTLAPAAYKLTRSAYQTTLAPIAGTAWPSTLAGTGAVVATVLCGYGDTAVSTPRNVQLYILAKLEADYGPRSQTAGSIAQSDRLSGLLDRCRTYA